MINKIQNSIFMRSINKLPVERTPLWLMRQAGRYLPEYRKTRAKAGDFLTLCKTPELACEVTLQPLDRFQLDAAILFSDILTIPDAMGLGLYFVEGEGPCFKHPLRSLKAIETLPTSNVTDDLAYVMEAASLIRKSMPEDLPLIGFSGSPWTLACYMVEGKSSRQFPEMLKLMYQHPEAAHQLLDKLANTVCQYLQAQVNAGANALMLFDTWGGLLNTSNYLDFSLHYMSKITRFLKKNSPDIPVILFTKGAQYSWYTAMADAGCNVIGVDWVSNLSEARAQIGARAALQGNLDPSILLTSPDCIFKEVEKVLDAYGTGSGHIFNLGHGITPDVPPEHVAALVSAVQTLSPKYHHTQILG